MFHNVLFGRSCSSLRLQLLDALDLIRTASPLPEPLVLPSLVDLERLVVLDRPRPFSLIGPPTPFLEADTTADRTAVWDSVGDISLGNNYTTLA
jgi:hypothetical protein